MAMNSLSTDKVPALLTLLVAIIGFFITDIMEEIRSGRPLLYDFSQSTDGTKSSNENEDRKTTLSLENASRDRSIVALEAMLFCDEAQSNCLRKIDGKFFTTPFHGFQEGDKVYIQPSFSEKSSSESEVYGELSLAPGGKIEIDFYPNKGMFDSLAFLINPETEQPVLLIPKRSIQGRFLRYYIEMMTLVFLLSVFLLILIILIEVFKIPALGIFKYILKKVT